MRRIGTLQCISPAWQTRTRRLQKLEKFSKQCCYQETAATNSYLITLRMLFGAECNFVSSMFSTIIYPSSCQTPISCHKTVVHITVKERETTSFQALQLSRTCHILLSQFLGCGQFLNIYFWFYTEMQFQPGPRREKQVLTVLEKMTVQEGSDRGENCRNK